MYHTVQESLGAGSGDPLITDLTSFTSWCFGRVLLYPNECLSKSGESIETRHSLGAPTSEGHTYNMHIQHIIILHSTTSHDNFKITLYVSSQTYVYTFIEVRVHTYVSQLMTLSLKIKGTD